MKKKKKKTNKKAFSLIELLAVITIIGMLLLIAIPTINKIITESRKRTYITTAKSYISDAANYVKEMEGEYYDPEASYYIDTYCLDNNSNPKSPFSEFEKAYVVVGYDDNASAYKYAWISYDKTGYGIDLIENDKLVKNNVQGGYEDITIRALNGKNGDIYVKSEDNGCIQERYYPQELPEEYLPILKTTTDSSTEAFWEYREKITNITFENQINIPADAEKTWDVSSTNNGKVMAYIKKNPNYSNFYDLWIQGDGKIYLNPDSSYLFSNFTYLDSINNIDLLDTSKVTNMGWMFNYTGRYSREFTLDLGDNFDTKNVTSMRAMFYYVGYSSTKFQLNLGDKFDTSNVTSMYCAFYSTGYNNPNFTINLGNKFDTSKVTNMGYMFYQTGYKSRVMTLNLGDKFDTSKVTDMLQMFFNTAYSNPNFVLNLGDKFDFSNVTNMRNMFYNNRSPVIYLNKSSFKSNVNISGMFYNSVPVTVYVKTYTDKQKIASLNYSNVNIIVT